MLRSALLLVQCSLLICLLGCVDLNVPDSLLPEIELPPLLSSPTPQPAPTPIGDTVTFVVPAPFANYFLKPNETIPGTQLQFLSKQDGWFNVRIDGYEAQKQAGDSFAWRGIIAPGALGHYDLRLIPTFRDTDLSANGSVALTVFEPEPFERLLPSITTEALTFGNIRVNEIIPQGSTIPGTSLVYMGEANGFVEFGGTNGLPTYALGDTVRWTGSLRPNIYAVYELRLSSIEAHGLRVRGSAELFIFPTAVPTINQ